MIEIKGGEGAVIGGVGSDTCQHNPPMKAVNTNAENQDYLLEVMKVYHLLQNKIIYGRDGMGGRR